MLHIVVYSLAREVFFVEYKHSYHHNAQKALSLSVFNAGSQQCRPDQSWGPAVRDHYVLHYVDKGQGVYLCGGQEYRCRAGDAFVIYPGERVAYRPDAHDPWEYHWVGFAGTEAKALLHLCGFGRHTPVRRLPPSAATYLQQIYDAVGPSAADDIEMTGRLYLFLAHCIRENPDPTPRAAQEYMEQAVRFIRGQYAQELTVAQIAAHVGVSRSQLYRAFQARYDQSPQAFLLQYRLREAAALLTSTDLSVEEVASSTGFHDPLYFSRVFRRQYGAPPSVFRTREKAQG